MSENFDTSTPLGRAMVGILSVFAQLEREQIRERMAMGRAERAQEALPAAQKREAVQLRMDELDGQIRRVLDLYQLGSINIDEIKGRLSGLEKERDALLATLKEKKRATAVKLKPATAHTLLYEFSTLVGSGDTDAMRDVLHELIARIVLHPTLGDVEIVWNF